MLSSCGSKGRVCGAWCYPMGRYHVVQQNRLNQTSSSSIVETERVSDNSDGVPHK